MENSDLHSNCSQEELVEGIKTNMEWLELWTQEFKIDDDVVKAEFPVAREERQVAFGLEEE